MPILLIGLYVACELVANFTASKPVELPGSIIVPAAVFIYAISFTLVDLINEMLGKKRAWQVIYSAFAADILMAIHIQFTPAHILATLLSRWPRQWARRADHAAHGFLNGRTVYAGRT